MPWFIGRLPSIHLPHSQATAAVEPEPAGGTNQQLATAISKLDSRMSFIEDGISRLETSLATHRQYVELSAALAGNPGGPARSHVYPRRRRGAVGTEITLPQRLPPLKERDEVPPEGR